MISSAQIKQIKSLHQKKFRNENREFLVEGVKMVLELLQNKEFEVIQLCIQEEIEVQFSQYPHIIVSEAEMERISALASPSPALAVVRMKPENVSIPAPKNLCLVLDGVRDPGNLGTILRLADWFGIETVYASEDSVELYNPKTVQSTMGALFRVAVYYTDLEELLTNCTIPVYGTVLEGGSDIYNANLPQEAVLVMGSESHGIRESLLPLLTHKLYIPSNKEGSESLNVAIATAVTCALFRQQAPCATK